MTIFLGIVGGIVVELATVAGSLAIAYNGIVDSILQIADKGYAIDPNVLEEVKKKREEEKKQKSSLVSKIFETLSPVLLFVPGINLLIAGIDSVKVKKMMITDPQVKESFVPMTEKEKEQYAKIKGKLQKMLFTDAVMTKKNEEDDDIEFFGNRPVVITHGVEFVNYEALMPLGYTLDEVRRLNEATTYSYRIGKSDGKNVAIIGIPDSNGHISRIRLKSENYKITHTYEEMTEEEAQDKTFTVYPFTAVALETVQKIVDEIKQSRIDSAVKANLEALQLDPKFESEFVSAKSEQVVSEKQQGRKLVKKMRPQNEKK